MKRIFGGRRYANVTSTLALVVALGGTGAYAANTIRSSDIVNGQVKRADIANNAVTSGKVGNDSLRVTDFRAADRALLRGPAGVPGAPGAKGDKGDKGEPGATGAPGTARAYALVAANGTVTLSKGIATANVNRIAAGSYCISGLGFAPENALATIESPGSGNTVTTGIGVGPSTCPAATQVRVFTRDSANALADHSFFLMLN